MGFPTLRFGAATAGSVAALTYGAQYAEQGAAFASKYLVSLVSPETLTQAAQSFTQAASGAGIYGTVGTVGFSAATLLVKEFADSVMNNLLNTDFKGYYYSDPSDPLTMEETTRSVITRNLKGAISYVAGSGITGGLVYAGLTVGGVYAAPTAATIVGTALSVHLVYTVLSKAIRFAASQAIITKATTGAVIGSALVAGKDLLGRVEVFLGLTPAAAGLTYSVGAGLGALTLGIKHLAVRVFDKFTPKFENKGEMTTHETVLSYLRDGSIEVAGSAVAGLGAYYAVTALELVGGPTAKLVIGGALISQMALKGILKMTGARSAALV